MIDQVGEYLKAGVQVVWVVDPTEQAVHVFQPDKPPRKLLEADTLGNEQILPSVSEPVGKLFEGI